jgi:hypothetical protein
MGMRRYLVVLDMDLLAADEELDLEPISYLCTAISITAVGWLRSRSSAASARIFAVSRASASM